MAKGKRPTTSHSERLLSSFAYTNGHQIDSSELGEDDIWSVVDDLSGGDRDNGQIASTVKSEWTPRADIESTSIKSHRRIERNDRHMEGLSLAFEDSSSSGKTASSGIVHQFRGGHDSVAIASPGHMASSAPLNVPDWSKILRVDSFESLHEFDDGFDEPDSEMVPPHEYLAREYARTKKIGGASVFEGVGRTLKGRDMRRVRDAVWSQTGFDG